MIVNCAGKSDAASACTAPRHSARVPRLAPTVHSGLPLAQLASVVRRRRASFVAQTPTPNLQSQCFSRSYAPILSTSLAYFILSTRGFSPWRPAAVIGTTARKTVLHSLRFSRVVRSAPDSADGALLSQPSRPISAQCDSGAICAKRQRLLRRTENSSRSYARRRGVHSRHRYSIYVTVPEF